MEAGDNPRSNVFYAEGFEIAALEMIDISLKSEKYEHSVDTLVYPICFNMRHSVELRLKKLWMDLCTLSKLRIEKLKAYRQEKLDKDPSLDKTKTLTFPDIKALQYHDINAIWMNISEYAPIIDERFTSLTNLLAEFIQDISEIDPTGQTFRYPADNESKTHLLDTPLISIPILKIRFKNLKNALVLLNELAEQIISEYYSCREYNAEKNEYITGTRISHTNKLSYFDIINITYSMSKYLNSAEPCHVAAKDDIKMRFNLSNKDYGKAVNIIHNDSILNNLLNKTNQLKFLNVEDLYRLFDIINSHAPLTELYTAASDQGSLIDWSSQGLLAIFDSETTQRKIDALSDLLTAFDDNKLAEIVSLYLLQKSDLYYANYMRLLKTNLQELKSFNGEIEEKKDYVNHYLEKTNLAQYIITSLYLFNFKGVVHDIVTNHGISSVKWYVRLTNGKHRTAYSEHASFLMNIASVENETANANAFIDKLKRK
ncbi:hypothetical protein [Scandinavium hiltneri]|nr:hypothetical protein [Scandinavium hiltneri]